MALFCRSNAIIFAVTSNSYCRFHTVTATFKQVQYCAELVEGIHLRRYTTERHPSNFGPTNKNYVSFENIVRQRRQEASKSILVQVQSARSYEELQKYCSPFGMIASMHHYKVQNKHYIIVEFAKKDSVKEILKSVASMHQDTLTTRAAVVWFRAERSRSTMTAPKHMIPLSVTDGYSMPSQNILVTALCSANTTSEQMEKLYETLRLVDIEIRLRFHTAFQIERCFSSLFPNILVQPFGSSINCFGKRCCDLDLVINTNENTKNKNSRMVFHGKHADGNPRQRIVNSMMVIGDTLHHFVPGIQNVHKVLHARVPIIEFNHIYTNMECDLSITNAVAIHMSELLYIFGELDSRVRPLVFTIRYWAHTVRLTHPNPGPWITNFALTLLVIFYLQQTEVLPSINILKQYALRNDQRIVDNGIDCTYLRDITRLPNYILNKSDKTLELLMVEFFEYYANFNFTKWAICLRSGALIKKPDASPMYICNPLEFTLNVSKNVNLSEIDTMQRQMIQAYRQLAENMDSPEHGLPPLLNLPNISTLRKRGADINNVNINVAQIMVDKDEKNKDISNDDVTSVQTSETSSCDERENIQQR